MGGGSAPTNYLLTSAPLLGSLFATISCGEKKKRKLSYKNTMSFMSKGYRSAFQSPYIDQGLIMQNLFLLFIIIFEEHDVKLGIVNRGQEWRLFCVRSMFIQQNELLP